MCVCGGGGGGDGQQQQQQKFTQTVNSLVRPVKKGSGYSSGTGRIAICN